MTLNTITRVVYGFFGVLYLMFGAGAMLMPTGWLPPSMVGQFSTVEMQSQFVAHLLQEFGTVVIALGLAFLCYARRKEWSPGFHWAMTFFFFLYSLIHWIGPHGATGAWTRGMVNSIPLALMLLLGLLRLSRAQA